MGFEGRRKVAPVYCQAVNSEMFDAHRGGNEFCGNPERHEYELYLAIEDIDHSRTKTKSPQTNGKCALRSRGAKGLRHPH